MIDSLMIMAVLALVASVQASRQGNSGAGVGYAIVTLILVALSAILTFKGYT